MGDCKANSNREAKTIREQLAEMMAVGAARQVIRKQTGGAGTEARAMPGRGPAEQAASQSEIVLSNDAQGKD